MKSYVKAIVIFDELGNKRGIELTQGVNIITGESKTGKSALVEIIDYCLCSGRCTIPKGKITDFGHMYCLVIEINNCVYVIGRQKIDDGGRIHISKEEADFNTESLELKYFEGEKFIAVKDAQFEIEYALGLQVSNLQVDEHEKKSKKASLRNMVSFMFQHQNLMASKFALFYRFSDFYKRKDVIEQFPIFAGIIGQKYYSEVIKLNNLKDKLKKLKKDEISNVEVNKKLKDAIVPLFKDYYAQLNIPFDENLTLNKIVKLANNLPNIDYNTLFLYDADGIVNRYAKLNQELELLREEERNLKMQKIELEQAGSTGDNYAVMLKELKYQTVLCESDLEDHSCPLCGNHCNDIDKLDGELIEASNWLDGEIISANKYANHFLESIRKIDVEIKSVISKIKNIYGQIKHIETKYFNDKNLHTLQEKVSYAKSSIVLFAENISEGVFKDVNSEIKELENDIKILEASIAGFDVETKLKKAEIALSTNMNKLALLLDFEDEFMPPDLNFRILDKTFDLYHHSQKDNTNIFLYEMGSGANWVSCHIALFLSFLRYFSEQKNSPMPTFLFFDQPSQVYFPQGLKKEDTINENDIDVKEQKKSDIEAVNKMFKTIFDEVASIGEDSGYLPQVIIAEHVDGEELEISAAFKKSIRKNWRDGKKLI